VALCAKVLETGQRIEASSLELRQSNSTVFVGVHGVEDGLYD
jgi:hypothetical protein